MFLETKNTLDVDENGKALGVKMVGSLPLPGFNLELIGRLSTEDLAALGYVPAPAWLPLKGADLPSLMGCVLALAEPGVIPHIGMMFPGGLKFMRSDGAPGFKPTHYQVLNPLPAIPGKGE